MLAFHWELIASYLEKMQGILEINMLLPCSLQSGLVVKETQEEIITDVIF